MELPLERLSRENLAILRQIALPIACGLSEVDVAKRLKISRSFALSLLDRLADEVEASSVVFHAD